MTSDGELLQGWRRGDVAAGRQLFERHYEALVRFFSGKVADRDLPDMVQHTLLACVAHASDIRSADAFRPYLFRIARTVLISHWRTRSHSIAGLDDGSRELRAVEPSPSEHLHATRQERLLLSALRRLPVDLQLALELHYWEGLSMAELADVLEAPEGTVKSTLRRARARLRERIDEISRDPSAVSTTSYRFEHWAGSMRRQIDRRR